MGWWGYGPMQGDGPLEIVCDFKEVIPGFYGNPLTLERIGNHLEELYNFLLQCKEEEDEKAYDIAISYIIRIFNEAVDPELKETNDFKGKTFIEIWGDKISTLICNDYNVNAVEDVKVKYSYGGTIVKRIHDDIDKILDTYKEDTFRDITADEFIKYNDILMKLIDKHNEYYAVVLAHLLMEADVPMPSGLKDRVVHAIEIDDDLTHGGWNEPEKRKEAMESFKNAVLQYGTTNNQDENTSTYPNTGLIATILSQ